MNIYLFACILAIIDTYLTYKFFLKSKENKFSFEFWDQLYEDIHNRSLLESKIINYIATR